MFDVQCSTFNVRILFVRLRSNKPLEISPSIVNDEVTSGTADMLRLAVGVVLAERPLMSRPPVTPSRSR